MKKISDKLDKPKELTMYRDLILATLDYHIENKIMGINGYDQIFTSHFNLLRTQALDHFEKGRLSILKQWFRDLTEIVIESRDLSFDSYIKDKTGLDIDIFQKYQERINRVIDKGRITTANQFYDIRIMVDHLSQRDPVDYKQIAILNNLLTKYEQKKTKA